MTRRVKVREQVRLFLEQLAPEPRRRIRLALQALGKEQGDRRALRETLAGFSRLKIGGYRVIFRSLPGGIIECVYAKERSLVYQLFEREMLEKLRHEDRAASAENEHLAEESPGKYSTTRRKRARPRKSIKQKT